MAQDGTPLRLPLSKPLGAASVSISTNVNGVAFFDNKLDEGHVALVRCAPRNELFGNLLDDCWLEFHWYAVALPPSPCA